MGEARLAGHLNLEGELNMDCGAALPVLRIFEIAKARTFHLDYPGLRVDFERR